ncbi:MAG: DUF308 domain-containing protein, partial [Nitrososphaeraceae archaeon]
MDQFKTSEKGVSKGIRILQIILGIITIAISMAIIVNPGFGTKFLVSLISIILFVVGIERISIGFLPKIAKSTTRTSNFVFRISNIALGALTIGLAILVLALPLSAIGFLVTLLAVGLLFIGIARIVSGIIDKQASKWSRALLIGVGILSIVVSFLVITEPFLGLFALVFMLAVNLLIIGI